MSKLLIIPSNTNIENTIEYTDGYLFGIRNMSVNMPCYIDLEELKKINKICLKNKKELFISLNKNFYSKELEELKRILKEIDKLNIKGIFYADTALVNLKLDNFFETELVWSQEHLTTNFETINYWNKYGVNYTYVSSDVTLDEINEISLNSNSKLIVPIFGYFPIFTSKRHLVKNYLDAFKLVDDSKINYMKKESKKYPIVDNNDGTVVYSNNILNGYNEYKNFKNIDYVTLNSFNIEENTFNKIVKYYKEKKVTEEDFEKLLKNLDKGFLYKETIYRVKKYD